MLFDLLVFELFKRKEIATISGKRRYHLFMFDTVKLLSFSRLKAQYPMLVFDLNH